MAFFIAVAAVGGGAAWWLNIGPGSMAQPVDVQGMSVAEATSVLTNANFVVLNPPIEKYDDEVAEGAVIGTDPVISEAVKKGTSVHLIVSKGPEPVDLPGFDDVSAESYMEQLARLKIAVTKTDDQFSADVAEGQVINVLAVNGTPIAPGTTLHHGDSVVLERSLGPVPDVVGKSVDDATSILTDRGLVVEISASREFSLTVPVGMVSRVVITPGVVRPGDVITVIQSKGPEMIAVPLVAGETIETARATLIAAGFKVTVITTIPSTLWSESWTTVLSTTPSGGSTAPKGSTVKISGGSR